MADVRPRGCLLESVLLARSVEEAHLYMDIRGAEPGARGHALIARGDDLVSTYTCVCHGAVRRFEFLIPTPTARVGMFGDEAPSVIIGPGEFLKVADGMSRSVPANVSGLTTAQVAEARRRVRIAAACLDEIVKFIPEGASSVPAAAFVSETDQEMFAAEPGRFGKSRLQAVAGVYREMAGRS